MEEKRKINWYNIAFIIVLGLIFTAIPFPLFIHNEILLNILNIFSRIVAIFVVFYKLLKEDLFNKTKIKFKLSDFKFLPFILLCFSNFFVSLILNYQKTPLELNSVLVNFTISLLTAVLEELLFRYLLLSNLKEVTTKPKAILYSALIFGATHLLNISGIASIIPVLLQVLYTTFLGLILGYLYLESNCNIFYTILYHFTFNFFNGFLAPALFDLKWDYKMILINLALGILIFLYAFILIILKRRKALNVTKNMDL